MNYIFINHESFKNLLEMVMVMIFFSIKTLLSIKHGVGCILLYSIIKIKSH